MMKEEFLAAAKLADIDNEKYEIIEKVYMYHPAIKSKKEIANLYVGYGMTVINDMLPRAEQVEHLEAEISRRQTEIERFKEQIKELS